MNCITSTNNYLFQFVARQSNFFILYLYFFNGDLFQKPNLFLIVLV